MYILPGRIMSRGPTTWPVVDEIPIAWWLNWVQSNVWWTYKSIISWFLWTSGETCLKPVSSGLGLNPIKIHVSPFPSLTQRTPWLTPRPICEMRREGWGLGHCHLGVPFCGPLLQLGGLKSTRKLGIWWGYDGIWEFESVLISPFLWMIYQ